VRRSLASAVSSTPRTAALKPPRTTLRSPIGREHLAVRPRDGAGEGHSLSFGNHKNMQVPSELKPAAWGAVGGAIALAVIGFSWGGWVTGGTADKAAKEAADTAIVRVLAPICAEKFQQQADAGAKMADLMKTSTWERVTFVEKGGWATMPGASSPSTGVARACAELLQKPKA